MALVRMRKAQDFNYIRSREKVELRQFNIHIHKSVREYMG